MRNSNQSIWSKVFASPIALLLFLIVLTGMSRAAWNMQKTASLVDQKLSDSKSVLFRLQSEKSTVEDRLGSLRTPEGVEAELRTKYRAVKEGESLAIIIDDETEETQSSSTEIREVEKGGVGERFLNAIGF